MKKYFYTNLLLYKIYYYLIHSRRNNTISLPKKGDSIYIDGFPRSANTFLVGTLNRVFRDHLKIGATHLHTTAALKIALKNNVRSYILIRDPKEAVASFYIMQEYYGKTKMINDK